MLVIATFLSAVPKALTTNHPRQLHPSAHALMHVKPRPCRETPPRSAWQRSYYVQAQGLSCAVSVSLSGLAAPSHHRTGRWLSARGGCSWKFEVAGFGQQIWRGELV